MAPGLYLGFDAATKTFAWSLSRVDLANVGEVGALRRAAAALGDEIATAAAMAPVDRGAADAAVDRASDMAAALATATAGRITLLAGAMADLAPGVADAALPTVARLRAVAAYVRDVIRPACESARAVEPLPLRVVVEYQMGDNAPARAVACALVTLFADEDVVFVGPSLKNSIALGPGLALGDFTARYASQYTANKNHARANFDRVLELFPSHLAPMPAARRGHVADSFMQVLGMLVRGDGNESTRF